jgi:hypothetical protein
MASGVWGDSPLDDYFQGECCVGSQQSTLRNQDAGLDNDNGLTENLAASLELTRGDDSEDAGDEVSDHRTLHTDLLPLIQPTIQYSGCTMTRC